MPPVATWVIYKIKIVTKIMVKAINFLFKSWNYVNFANVWIRPFLIFTILVRNCLVKIGHTLQTRDKVPRQDRPYSSN